MKIKIAWVINVLIVVLFLGWFAYAVHLNVDCKLKGGVLASGMGSGGFVCAEPVR